MAKGMSPFALRSIEDLLRQNFGGPGPNGHTPNFSFGDKDAVPIAASGPHCPKPDMRLHGNQIAIPAFN